MRFVNHPIFRWAPEPWFGFHAPSYEPSLISELKSVQVRAWDPIEKTWWYRMQDFPVVEAACASYFRDEMGDGRFVNFMMTAPTAQQMQQRINVLTGEVARLKSELVKRGGLEGLF